MEIITPIKMGITTPVNLINDQNSNNCIMVPIFKEKENKYYYFVRGNFYIQIEDYKNINIGNTIFFNFKNMLGSLIYNDCCFHLGIITEIINKYTVLLEINNWLNKNELISILACKYNKKQINYFLSFKLKEKIFLGKELMYQNFTKFDLINNLYF